jgi:hypothetical protein
MSREKKKDWKNEEKRLLHSWPSKIHGSKKKKHTKRSNKSTEVEIVEQQRNKRLPKITEKVTKKKVKQKERKKERRKEGRESKYAM